MPDPPLHPLALKKVDQSKHDHLDFLKGIKGFRPIQTVFEAKMHTQGGSTVAVEVMNKKRAFHSSIIAKQAKIKQQATDEASAATTEDGEGSAETGAVRERPKKKKRSNNFVDEDFFLNSYQSSNSYSEKGLAVKEYGITSDAIFDVAPDEAVEEQKQKQRLRWDRKDMKYKKLTLDNKIKVERKFYQQWTKSTHGRIQKEGEQEVPFGFANKQKQLGLQTKLAKVNQEVREKFKSKQLKPTQQIKSEKLKKWKTKTQQEAKRTTRLHERKNKIKKGVIGFKAKHKYTGGGGGNKSRGGNKK